MTKLNTALAGYGAGGSIYNAPILSSTEGFLVKKILTSGNRTAAQRDFPKAEIIQEYEKILSDPEIDLVVITTPNHLHQIFAEEALRAGKHVVLEKPFTPKTGEAQGLINLAKANNRILSINHNRRWDSDFLTIQKLLQENLLGPVIEFEAHFDRFRDQVKEGWKEDKEQEGSGILYDLGSHLIDQALVLFGMPGEIFAHLRIQREDAEVVDNFELLLLYPDLKVTLKAGMLVQEVGPKFRIHGRKGSFVKYGMDVQEAFLKNQKKPSEEPNWGEEPQNIWGRLSIGDHQRLYRSEIGDYRAFYRSVYDSIMGTGPLLVKPEEAKNVIRVIELALKSHSEKKIISVMPE